MKNNIKKTILPITLIFGILFILSLTFASATVAFANPVKKGNYTTNILFNITYSNVSDIIDPTTANSKLYYNTSGTAWTNVACGSAAKQGNLSIICTLSISAIADTNAVVFNFTLGNASTNASGAILGPLTIDDTVPTCTSGNSLRQMGDMEVGTSNTLTCACTDNIDSSPTHTRTLTKPGGTTVSISSSPYTATGTDINLLGTYTFSCGGRDYSGGNTTNTVTFSADTSDDGEDLLGRTTSTQTITSSNKFPLYLLGGFLLFIVIIGVIAWFITNK